VEIYWIRRESNDFEICFYLTDQAWISAATEKAGIYPVVQRSGTPPVGKISSEAGSVLNRQVIQGEGGRNPGFS